MLRSLAVNPSSILQFMITMTLIILLVIMIQHCTALKWNQIYQRCLKMKYGVFQHHHKSNLETKINKSTKKICKNYGNKIECEMKWNVESNGM